MIRNVGFFFDRYSTQTDAILFAVVFFSGFVVQLVLRLWLDVSAAVVTFLLLLLMSVYAALIQFNTASKTGADRSGDTLYFLGFIFTTITLGIAMFKIGESDREFATSIVLSDLGIGITTTVYGLVLRVLFSLMRTGTEEIETRTLSNLNQRSKSLSGKLTRASQIAEETTIVVQQVLDETQKALSSIASSTDEKFSQVYDDTLARHRTLLEKNTAAMENLYERIDQIEVPNDLVLNKIEKSFEVLDKSLVNFEAKVVSISLPANIVEAKIDAAIKPLIETIESMESAVRLIKDQLSSLSELDSAKVTKVFESLKKLGDEVVSFQKKLSGESINTQGFDQMISETGKKYSSAVSDLSAKLTAMTLPDDHLLELIDNAFSHYHSFIADTSKSIEDDSVKLKTEIGGLKKSLSELSVQVADTTEALKKPQSSGNLFNMFRR